MISAGDTKLYKSFGSLIIDYRQFHKISQERFAESLGVSIRELRNWEVDRHRARIDNLHDLSEKTGIPMQVCVALNADQPVWYSIRKRRFAYSSIEGEVFSFQEYFKHREASDEEFLIKDEPITKEKHISMILSCHQQIFGTKRPLGRNVIKEAGVVLPDLNRIIFDNWGHYVGHQICLPLKKEVYEEIKKREPFEDYLTSEKVSDIVTLREGVIFLYSIFAANVSVGYLLNILNVRYLSKIDMTEHRKRYLFSVHTATKEGMEFLKNLGMRIVKEYKHLHNEVTTKIFEREIDVLMNPLSPFGTIRWMLEMDSRRVRGRRQSVGAKREGLSVIATQAPNNADHPPRKHIEGKYQNEYLSVDEHLCADDAKEIGPDLTKISLSDEPWAEACPNSKCALYGKTGKENIVSNGTYRTKDGTLFRRFLCKECRKSFCSRSGSIFHGLRSPKEKVLMAIKFLVKGMSLRGIAKVLGVNYHTVRHWLKVAAERSEKVDAILMKELNVSQAELDILWTFVKKNCLHQRAILGKGKTDPPYNLKRPLSTE